MQTWRNNIHVITYAKPFVSVCTVAKRKVPSSFFQSWLCIKYCGSVLHLQSQQAIVVCCQCPSQPHSVVSFNQPVTTCVRWNWNFLLRSLLNYHFHYGQLCPAVGHTERMVESSKAHVTSTGWSYIGQRTSYGHGAYDGSIWQHVIQSYVHSPYLIGFGCTFLKQLWDILTLFEKPEMCGQKVWMVR